MNAGKSTTLLQSNYNYNERGMDTLLFIPQIDCRHKVGTINSRIGLAAEAVPFDNKFNLYEYTAKKLKQNNNIKCVLIDEVHFLTKEHVLQMCDITDNLNIPVLAYGLRSDFQGNPFESSSYLLALADNLIELKTICHCGKKAIMNMRIDSKGNAVREGAQFEVGGNERYISVCRKHFKEGKAK
jgi:thymidine kinase